MDYAPRWKPHAEPHAIPELEDAEVMALKQLAVGKASEYQQKIALKVIVSKFSGTYDMSYRPGGPEGERATAFAEGRRFVGTRILEAIEREIKEKPENATGRTDRRNQKPAGTARPAGKQ